MKVLKELLDLLDALYAFFKKHVYFNKRILLIIPFLALALMCIFHQRSAREAAERPDESFEETNAGLLFTSVPSDTPKATATATTTSTSKPLAITQTAEQNPTRTPTLAAATPTPNASPTITFTSMPTATPAATTSKTSTPRPTIAGGVTIARDIQYQVVEGYPANFINLDIYTPGNGGGLPVMIFVHGGSWREGDKSDTGTIDDVFTRSGYVFISINYRLYPNANYRTQVQDVAYAITWVHENITAYGGDPEQIYLMGYSAGAHLAALVSTNVGFMLETGLDTTTIKGVIVLDTLALDLSLLGWTGTIPDEFAQIFGVDEQGWINASPVNYIVSGRYVPPMAVAWSGGIEGENQPLRAQIANSFIKRLGEVGVLAVPINADTKTHEQIALDLGKTGDAVTGTVFGFLEKIGAPGLTP
jgi:arylformamidase